MTVDIKLNEMVDRLVKIDRGLIRVRIIHDDSPDDPRDWDDMCEITHRTRWGKTGPEQIADLIQRTKGWAAATEMLWVAYDEQALSMTEEDMVCKLEENEDFRNTWLEAVKDELIVQEFSTQHENYIAHTTPTLCQITGTPWDRAAEAMQGSIETFKKWADGDVWGFVIEEWTGKCACEDCDAGEWVHTDSCWGFYGSDPFENGMSEHVPEDLHDLLRKAEIEYKI